MVGNYKLFSQDDDNIMFAGRFLKRLRKDFQDKLASASSTADESFGNVVTVRSFSNELKMVNHYSEDIDESFYLGKKLAFFIGTFMGVVTMLMYVSRLFRPCYVIICTVHLLGSCSFGAVVWWVSCISWQTSTWNFDLSNVIHSQPCNVFCFPV